MDFVPLDLVGDDGGDEVVEVGGGGDVGSEGVAAVVEPFAAAAGGALGGPAGEVVETGAGERLGGLTEDDLADVGDAGGETLDGVGEGAHVGGGFGGAGVEGGGGGEVGRFETCDADGTGALEEGGVGADVEIDLALTGSGRVVNGGGAK